MTFDLQEFLPYLLNRAAEQSSLQFQQIYKSKYSMLRTEWRVLFHLGNYGEMTSKDICRLAGLHKTKVSRAVTALQNKRFIARKINQRDRRFEILFLTSIGEKAYLDLQRQAQIFQAELVSDFTEQEMLVLNNALTKIAKL